MCNFTTAAKLETKQNKGANRLCRLAPYWHMRYSGEKEGLRGMGCEVWRGGLLATSSYMQILTNRCGYRQVRLHGIEVQWAPWKQSQHIEYVGRDCRCHRPPIVRSYSNMHCWVFKNSRISIRCWMKSVFSPTRLVLFFYFSINLLKY